MKFRKGMANLGLASLTSASVVFSVAHAQTPAAPEVMTAITVTGSRVIANGNDSPTPVTVVTTQQMLQVSPGTITDAVNLMPALQGSQSTASNPGGGQRNGAAAYVNLRNMGDLRTLVLMDGHRVVPTINQMNANVDSSVVPQMLIKQIDVVTGGASAVYGSDAVSGVVNFITDKGLNGIKLQASQGISKYHDAKNFDLGVAAGTSILGGRGHVEFSAEARDDAGIPDQTKRPFFEKAIGGAGLGTVTSPYTNVENQRISNASFGGLIANGGLSGQQFAQNGILSTFNPGTPTGTANIASGGDGAWYRSATIKSAQHLKQVFGRLDYDFSNTLHGYLQLSGTDVHTHNAFRAPLEVANIGYSNPYLASVPQIQAQLATNPNGSFQFRKFIDMPALANQWTKTYMFMSGLEGDIGDYKWDLQLGRSTSTLKAQNEVNVDQGRFFAAADPVISNGQIVCRAALTNPNYANCVPLNLFGPTSESQQALDYILAKTWNKNRTVLSEVSASLRGAPVSTWAGPVNMALSGELRRIEWSITSNAGPSDPIDCVGTRFGTLTGAFVTGNCNGPNTTVPTSRWLQNTVPSLSKVTQNVRELAYEADVPLAKDLPLAKEFNVNGAVRYTNYSTSGDVSTWKIGAVWRIIDDVTLRGTRSRDIRAPNLFELYGPTTIAPSNVTDPLTRTTAGVPVSTISNSSLTPERAKSWTAGVVWTPSFIPRFSLSIDGFWVRVENAISQLQGNSASLLNLCAGNGGATPACNEVIIRPFPWTNTTAANFPTSLLQKWLNIASFKTYGADVEANYRARIMDRNLDLRALVSYQPHLVFDQGPAGIIDLGNAAAGVNLYPASPSIKYTLIGRLAVTDRFYVSVMQRGRRSMKAIALSQGGTPAPVFANNGGRVEATSYTNLTLSYEMPHASFVSADKDAGRTEFYLNVQNLFNRQPSVLYAGANANPGLGLGGFFPANGDDIVGRYFTVGLRSRF